jgi:hypothetical protein
MASAGALRKKMAGHFPAIRIAALAMIGLVFSLPARAQIDPATRGQLQYLHRSLVIAEENLGVALRDKDIPRAKLANDLLFNLSSSAKERKLSGNPCLDALESLQGVAAAVLFAVHPSTAKGDLASMNQEQLRFSDQMRPAPEVLNKWYSENSAAYRARMAACEQETNAGATARFLPDKFTQK